MSECKVGESGYYRTKDPEAFNASIEPSTNIMDYIREMPSPPTMELLRATLTLPRETGFFKSRGMWCISKSDGMQLYPMSLPPWSESVIHSHPCEEGDKPEDAAIPSVHDFHNAFTHRLNFIVSDLGLTHYYLLSESARWQFKKELQRFRPLFTRPEEREDYLRFLAGQEIFYHLYPWEELDQEAYERLIGIKSSQPEDDTSYESPEQIYQRH